MPNIEIFVFFNFVKLITLLIEKGSYERYAKLITMAVI